MRSASLTVWGGEPPFKMMQGAVDAALVVTDSPASRAWYEALLGVAPTPSAPMKTSDGGQMFRYKHGASFIKLVEHSPVPPKYDGAPESAVGYRWLRVPMVAPLDTPERVGALGGKERIGGPDANGEWTTIDPDGNRVYVSGEDPGYDIEFGVDRVARVDADFLSGPSPTGSFVEPSVALVGEKQHFRSSRRARWFGL